MQCSFFEKIHANTMYLNKDICINAKHLTCHLMTLVEVFHMTDDCMSKFLNTLYVQTYTCTVHMYMTVYRFYTYCILMVLSLNLVIMSLVYLQNNAESTVSL